MELGLDRAGAGEEETDALLVHERWHRVFLLACHVQRLPARYEHVEVGAGAEQGGDLACGLHDLLEVVEEQEQSLVCDVLGETVRGADGL